MRRTDLPATARRAGHGRHRPDHDGAPRELDTTGFERLYFGSNAAAADAATTLALLPPDQAAVYVDRLCGALDEVDAVNAISVAGALLDIVFPEGYDEEQPLSDQQRRVVYVIAASRNAWTFNANLHEVLRYNNLPTDRDRLHALSGVARPATAPG